MIYYEKAEFVQIFRSLSLNSGAIRLKRLKNLTQISFPSLQSVKPDKLLGLFGDICHFYGILRTPKHRITVEKDDDKDCSGFHADFDISSCFCRCTDN